MTTLEIVLLCLSIVETAISYRYWKKLNEARARYEKLEEEYDIACGYIGVWRNAG